MQELPLVAVIIPAHNEARYIAQAVASIYNQNYPRDRISITVVDNNSGDATSELASNAGANVIACPTGKVGAVRNIGVANTDSNIVAFMDGDCEAVSSWISAAIEKLSDITIGAVGGPCFLPKKSTWVERAFVGSVRAHDGETARLAGSSLIMRRADFCAIGGFSETLTAGEDDELSARIRMHGLKVLSLNQCAVIHNDYPKSLRGIFLKQLWHARNQIEAADSWYEPMLMLTHMFVLTVLSSGLIFFFAPHNRQVALLPLSVAAGLIGVLTALKLKRTGGGIRRVIPLYIVNAVYLSARAFALIRNHWARLRVNS